METINIEKEFNIEIIASVIENKLLTLETHPKKIQKFTKEILNYCNFVTGENVDFGNLSRFAPIINQIVLEQYPTIKRITPIGYSDLDREKISNIIKIYKEKYGDKLIIKSLKKKIVKTLKNTK